MKPKNIEGFWDVSPKIEKISFQVKGKIEVYLKDYQNNDNKKDNITKRTPNKI